MVLIGVVKLNFGTLTLRASMKIYDQIEFYHGSL